MNNCKKITLLSLCLFIIAIITSACGAGGSSGICDYIPLPTETKKLTLSTYNVSLEVGQQKPIRAYVNGEDKTDEVTFTPINKNTVKATIEDGIITGIEEGKVDFKAHYDGADDVKLAVTVIALPELVVNPERININIGETSNVTVTFDGQDITTVAIYTPEDNTIATVNKGIITGLKAGTTKVNVHYDGAKEDKAFFVTVIDPTLPTLQANDITLTMGETDSVVVTLNGEPVTDIVTYQVDKEEIATVDKGQVEAIKSGETTVIVHLDGANDATFTIKVTGHLTVQKNDEIIENLDINLRHEDTIKVMLDNKYVVTDYVTYEDYDENIISIDNGNITTKKTGTTTVRVHLDGSEADVAFTVNVIGVLTVSQDNFNINLRHNDQKVIVYLNGNDIVTSDVTFTFAPEDIVTIGSDGTITTLKSGTTTVTAKLNDCEDDATFTVNVIGILTLSQKSFTMTVRPDNETEHTNITVFLNGEDVTNDEHLTFTATIPEEDREKDIFEIGENGLITAGIDGLDNIEVKVTLEGASNDETFNVTIIDNTTDVILRSNELKQLGYTQGDAPTDLNFPSVYEYDAKYYKIRQIQANLFNGNLNTFLSIENLTNVTIPKSVKIIQHDAFSHIKKLTTITLSKGLKTIGEKAFKGHDGWGTEQQIIGNLVTEIVVPETVTTIERGAFEDMYHLKKITLPQNLETLGEHAFRRCYALEEITIPNKVTTIGNLTFSQDVYRPPAEHPTSEADTYPTSLETVVLGEGITEIGYQAFYQCTALKRIVFGSNLKTIGQEAFYECTALEKIEFPEGLETIGKNAFSKCYALEEITFPNSLKTIGEQAFNTLNSNYTALKKVTFGENSQLETIGNLAFGNNKNTDLAITIPDSVTSIGRRSFNDVQNIYYSDVIKNRFTGVDGFPHFGATYYNGIHK